MLRPDDLGVQLICPDCRRPLARTDHQYICSDGVCRRAYAIVDEIPSLVVEESHILELAEWQEQMAAHEPPPARHGAAAQSGAEAREQHPPAGQAEPVAGGPAPETGHSRTTGADNGQ